MDKGFTMDQALHEASRCLLCHEAPCNRGCPADTSPATFIRKLRFRNIKGAIKTIKERNILGGVCEALARRVHGLLAKVGIAPELVISGGIAQNAGVIAGVLLVGKGVEVPAATFDRLGDLFGSAAFGALEEHVLDQVGDARFVVVLVAAARLAPEPDRGGANVADRFDENADAVREAELGEVAHGKDEGRRMKDEG